MQLPVKYKKNLDVSIRAKALRHAVLQNRIETTRFNIETPILKTNYFVWESMHMDSCGRMYISNIPLAITFTDGLRPVFINYSI
jgi:hypothetical protein